MATKSKRKETPAVAVTFRGINLALQVQAEMVADWLRKLANSITDESDRKKCDKLFRCGFYTKFGAPK
jgi:hypothetical protein